jgi:hypothetical protein
VSGPKPKFLADCRGALSEQDVLQHKDHSQLDERRTRFVAEQAETSCRTDEEDVMRGSLTPMLGAIGPGVCLTALTQAANPDVAPDDVIVTRSWIVSPFELIRRRSISGSFD